MKRLLSIILCGLAAVLVLAGCHSPPPTPPHTAALASDDTQTSFAKANAVRQGNGLPPLTWEQYLEYTHPVSAEPAPTK